MAISIEQRNLAVVKEDRDFRPPETGRQYAHTGVMIIVSYREDSTGRRLIHTAQEGYDSQWKRRGHVSIPMETAEEGETVFETLTRGIHEEIGEQNIHLIRPKNLQEAYQGAIELPDRDGGRALAHVFASEISYNAGSRLLARPSFKKEITHIKPRYLDEILAGKFPLRPGCGEALMRYSEGKKEYHIPLEEVDLFPMRIITWPSYGRRFNTH